MAKAIPSYSDLDGCLLQDRLVLQKALNRLHERKGSGKPVDEMIDRLQQRLAESRRIAELRKHAQFQISFAPELPISEQKEQIAKLVSDHQVIVLCGETGSGKSTQLPKICLELGRGVHGRIAHTQPRRLAARALAQRISEELGTPLGTTVGYRVRFQDRVRPESRVKLLTDGMLLAEMQKDHYLNEYDTIILDEAHERSLNIDFILGYLKQLLSKRRDLKLIVTSATIDPERFSKHFWDAPIINVSGRTYPVELRYRAPGEEAGGERDPLFQQAIVDAVDELDREGRGDVLVFLSGEREIRETAENLRKHKLHLTEVLPLYARLGSGEQHKIFNPGGPRRIILATNVAETSLTVPGIRYVVDAGFARVSRYSHRSKIQRLPVERISQASANQRMGRCGRVEAGICIRLYEEEDYLNRSEFTEPEISRTNLAAVILQMKILGFGDIEKFPFVDKPDSRLIKDGYRVLEEIGALDKEKRISSIGRSLAKLPVDPRIGRMLLTAAHTHCLNELLVVTAALSIQDPRERPMDKQQAADEVHRKFHHELSDFMGFVSLWDHLEEQRRHLSKRKFSNYCKSHFLSWTRVQEWHDIHHQLRGQMHEMGFKENHEPADYELIHKAILSGLLSNIGFKSGAKGHEYLGARNSHFHVFPGSGLFKNQPKWLVSAELVETTKLYARTVAQVKPEWIESVSGHLVKKSYSEPHWEKNRGQVTAYLRVNLFGLPLVMKRRVNYGPINPVESREIFIRSALVDQDYHTRAPFWRHNRELIRDVENMEQKSRRKDILVDDLAIYDFYDQRIPADIFNGPAFEQWLKKQSSRQPKLLHMRLENLIVKDETQRLDDIYPDQLDLQGMQLPLRYRFDPGKQVDGVTLEVPQAVVNQVSESRCQWLVPGLLRERVVALLKSLPKSLRRSFVPVPDYADAFVSSCMPTDQPLTQALALFLKQKTGIYIPEDAWQPEQVPEYLQMRFQIKDEKGRKLAASRDLHQLKKRFGSDETQPYNLFKDTRLEREGIKDWDFDKLPEMVDIKHGGIELKGYPALVDCTDSVAIKVLDAKDNAEKVHHCGLRRLFMLRMPKDVRYLRKNIDGLASLRLKYARAPLAQHEDPEKKQASLEEELVELIFDRTFIDALPPVNGRDAFLARLDERRGELMTIANQVTSLVGSILEIYQPLRKQLYAASQINWIHAVADMKAQLDALVYRGCFAEVPYQHLQHYPRYLSAIAARLDKLAHALARDRSNQQLMEPLYDRWRQRQDTARKQHRVDPRLEEIRWALEELRVSLFSQELKTAYPVSVKRIDRRWKELGL